jgi:hypothetical protein
MLKDRKERRDEMDNTFSEKKNLKKLSENFKPYREYSYAEKKVNFGNLKNEMDNKEKELITVLNDGLNENKKELMDKINKAVKAGDYIALQKLSVEYGSQYTDEIYEKTKELYNFGKNAVAAEMKVKTPVNPKEDMDMLKAQAGIIVDDHKNKILTKTKMKAMENMVKGVAAKKVMEKVNKTFEEAAEELGQKTSSIISGGSINMGRRLTQFANKDKIYALQRSELLDDRTCLFCMSMDGRVVDLNDPWAREDIFHSNCRGIWVEIMNYEAELPEISGVPKSIENKYEGMNDFQQLKSPQVTKASLAADYIKDAYKKEIASREKKIEKYEKAGTYQNRVEAHKEKIDMMQKVLDKLE